jgi:hypothetical protein
VAQTGYSSFSGALQPLANRPLGDAQGLGDLLLLPALLVQFPGSQAAAFPPVASLA